MDRNCAQTDRMRRSHFICGNPLPLWAVAVLLMFGFINAVPCDVQHTPDGTLYSVPEFKGTHCDYSWNNSTSHKLGTNLADEVNELVVTRSDHTLLTRKCVEKILYRQDCQEKIREATCNATCSGNVGHLETGHPKTGNQETGGSTRHRWCALAGFCIVLLVLLMLLVLIYRRGKRSHTSMKAENNGSNMGDV